jgi:hypothetical protein
MREASDNVYESRVRAPIAFDSGGLPIARISILALPLPRHES